LPPELQPPPVSAVLALDPTAWPTLAQVTEQLVDVMADRGLTAAQAQCGLTDRVPAVTVPEVPTAPAKEAVTRSDGSLDVAPDTGPALEVRREVDHLFLQPGQQ